MHAGFFFTDLPRITASKWKELEVVPEWIKRDLILVAVKHYDGPVLFLHTYGKKFHTEQDPRNDEDPHAAKLSAEEQVTSTEYEFRTYLMGNCPALLLCKYQRPTIKEITNQPI